MRIQLFALAFVGAFASCTNLDLPAAIDSAPPPVGVGSTNGVATTVVDGGTSAGTGAVALVDGIPMPHGLALSDTSVLFTSGTRSAAVIASVPKTGGVVTPLVVGAVFPTELLDVNGVLVWIDLGTSVEAGAVFKLDPATGATTQISAPLDSPSAIASDGTFVYIASNFESGGVSIDRVPLAGGPDFSVTTVLGDFTSAGMVIDSQNAYFVGVSLAGGVLYSVPLTGGPADTLFSTNGGTFGDVAVTGGNVYWALDTPALGGATIFSIPIGGGAPTVLAATQPHAVRLAFDPASLFWTTGADGEVISAPLGGGATTVVASGLNSAFHIAAPAEAIYVTTATGIVRIVR
jgi:hypothetical protein